MSRSNHPRRAKVRRGYLPADGEAAFQERVLGLAGFTGWELRYHTHDSRRSAPGFPDLVLIHPAAGQLLFAELKAEQGRVRPEQRVWMDALRACGQEVYLWKPSDWPEIEERLKRPGKEIASGMAEVR